MTDAQVIAVISGTTSIVTAVITAVTTVIVTNRNNAKKKSIDLAEDFILEDKIQPILDDLRFRLDANRVALWYGSNGEKTLAMQHLKKMSLTNESKKEHLPNRRDQCQLLPITIFDRAIRGLYSAESEIIVIEEEGHTDTLAGFSRKYGMHYTIVTKILNKKGNWAGILVAGWDEQRELTEEEKFEFILAAKKIPSL